MDLKKVLEVLIPVETEIENCLEADIETNSKEIFDDETPFKGSISIAEEIKLLMVQKKGELDELFYLRKLRSEAISKLHEILLSGLLPKGIISKSTNFFCYAENTDGFINIFNHKSYTNDLVALSVLDRRIIYLESLPPSPEQESPRFPASLNILALRKSRSTFIVELSLESAIAAELETINNLVPAPDLNSVDPLKNLYSGVPGELLIKQEEKFLKLIELNERICTLEKGCNM